MSEKKVKFQKAQAPYKNTFESTCLNSSIFSNIIKSLPGSIYCKDKEGKYLWCNDTMLEMSGVSSVIGKTDFDLVWADKAPILRENDLKAMKLNCPIEFEEEVPLANGEHVVVLTRKVPLHDEHGLVIGIIGTSLNITRRKEQELVLRTTQEQMQSTLESIVANMPGHVYWKDTDGVYLGCNNRQARSLGFHDGYELIGKTDFDLPWGENKAELFRRNDKHIMETGKTEIIEEKAQVDGKDAIVLSHKSPMRNKQGDIIGLLGISIDITDRKKIESELQHAKELAETASRAKTEFLENMRHDIRTPLIGIVGFSDIIKSEAWNPQIKEYADNLIASSHALLELMDEVLEAIRVSSGEIPKLKKKFVLSHIIQHAIDLNKAKAASKRLDLSVDIDKDIPKYLIGDNIRIHRIMIELLANALNFTDVGFVKLSAHLASRHRRELVVKLIVEDSGMGIPKDKQQEIFVHFKRLTPSYKGIYKGAGLGLSVVKQFIDDLDGEIYVDSELHQGSTFTCVIPLKVSLLEDDTGLQEDFDPTLSITTTVNTVENTIKPSNSPMLQPQYRILVVEDNIIAQKVAQSILTQASCYVDIASNGQEALNFWKQNNYDLIFMDIGLPDMDGYQVTHHIRVKEIAKNRHTPIIALTAHVGAEDKQRCIEAGMNAVLSKPLSNKSCHEILNSFITQKKPGSSPQNSWTSDLPTSDEELFKLSPFPVLNIKEGVATTGSEDLLREMLQFMLKQSLHDDLNALRKAHDALDWDNTQKLAHKIKGGVVYVGATRMKMACQYLERYWKSGQRTLLEPLYQQLLQVTDVSIRNIEQWINAKLPDKE